MIRYSSTTLESIRFDNAPTPQERRDLSASGWEQHLYQPRLFVLKREVKVMRFKSVSGFVLPEGACGYDDPRVLEALFGVEPATNLAIHH